MENFSEILDEFGLNTSGLRWERIPTGHINDTYKIYSDGGRYILQKINTHVFKNPEKMMRNIDYAQTLIKKGLEAENSESKFPEYLKSGNRNYLLKDGFWRIYPYIESVSISPDCTSIKAFGSLLGKFHRYTESADISKLCTTIPDFHNIEKNISAVLQCDNITSEQRNFFSSFLDFYANAKKCLSPLRLVHNDVKWANVLINPVTLMPETLIDYDTVMAGYAAFDFGDAVRSACVTESNELNLQMLRSFSAGYMGEYKGISPEEAALGAISVTAELAARYLRDYLSGGNYFANLSAHEKLEKYEKNIKLAKNMYKVYNNNQTVEKVHFKVK